jgi:hypothetical protein
MEPIMTTPTETTAIAARTARTATGISLTAGRFGVARGHGRLAARLTRSALSACLVVSCALGAGSCAQGHGATPVSPVSPVSPVALLASAPARRPVRSDWGMRGCKETVVVEAPVCGGESAKHGL